MNAQFAGRANDLLALVAARLVVALHRMCAKGRSATNGRQGIVEAVDHRFEIAISAIQNETRAEQTRSDHCPAALQFTQREHRFSVRAGVVRCRYAIGQIRIKRPVLLRAQAFAKHADVRVHINDARHNCAVGHVNYLRILGNGDLISRANGDNAVAIYHDRAALNHFIALHGNDARVGQGQHAIGLIRR